jgi:hypothetical protein
MPAPKYTGDPMGSGNPPGKHSEGYLGETQPAASGHFVDDGSYRGDMNVGTPSTATMVGNQPATEGSADVNKWSNKTQSI